MPALMKRFFPVLCVGLSACFPQGKGSGTTEATPPTSGQSTQTAGVQNANSTPTTPATTATKTTSFDTDKKLEYVDLYVETGDPSGMRVLAPYLLKNEEWMLVKCEMLSPTSKHYRFQRVTTADGRSLPSVDLFPKR